MSLRRVVRERSAQDVGACHACYDCDIEIREGMDIPLGSIIQMILFDDEEVLSTRTLWSDAVLDAARGACKRGLNMYAILLALRSEAQRRHPGVFP